MSHALMIVIKILLIGVGATVLMDLWALMLKRLLNIPPLNWAMVGRWIGHFPSGKFKHVNIAKSPQVSGELFIGWSAHYMIGIGLAILFIAIFGQNWLFSPRLWPAIFFGVISVVLPFFIMQPCLGVGVAVSKSPNPLKARALSLSAHSVFGLGLYGSAVLLSLV